MALPTIFAKVQELEKRLSSLCDSEDSKDSTMNLNQVSDRVTHLETLTAGMKQSLGDKITQLEAKMKGMEEKQYQIPKTVESLSKLDSNLVALQTTINKLSTRVDKLESA
jgi:septation ring formation regulator EzrA